MELPTLLLEGENEGFGKAGYDDVGVGLPFIVVGANAKGKPFGGANAEEFI